MMTTPNWNKAPAWANWAAQDSFGGDWVYTQSYPKEQGVTNIWPRPSNPSDTIKELSDMCLPETDGRNVIDSGWIDLCQPIRIMTSLGELGKWLKENPDMKARVIPTVQNGDGEYVTATDHAAELAEALEDAAVVLKCMGGEFSGIAKKAETALTKYKQSRGE